MRKSDRHDDQDEEISQALSFNSRNSATMEFNGPVQFAAGVIHGDVHHHHHSDPLLPREPEAKEFFQNFQLNIPLFAKDRFVKRDILLEQISATFLPDQSVAQTHRPITALTAHGLGGVGKTQLALYYYYHSPKSYSFRCWFPAERLDTAYRVFCKKFKIEIGEKASIEEISQEVKQWLEEHPGWLLVYDNVTDCNSIAAHLPATGGDVLVTSRHTQEWDQIGGREILIDIVSEEEAIELVKRALSRDGKPVLLVEQEEVSLRELANELGYLPLALAQAAAYIRSCPGMMITSYLDKYKSTPDSYLDKPLNSRIYPKSVAKTWLITIEAIKERLPAALPVFKACAYLAPDAIPTQLLSQLILELNSHSAEPEEKEKENEEAKLKNNPLLDEILICLSGFSMIGYNKETNHVSIHRLVQVVMRQGDDKELSSSEERFKVHLKPLSNTLLKIDALWHRDAKYYSMVRELQPHFEAVISYLKSLKLKESQILLTELYDTLGMICTVIRDAKNAVNYCEHALQIKTALYEKDHLGMAATLVNLGNAYGLLGDHKKKYNYLERALKIEEMFYEKDHIEVARILTNLGSACGSLGDHVKERDYLERALKIMEIQFEKGHIEIAITLNNLGNAYGSLGDHVKKCAYLERALKIEEMFYEKDHIEIARTLTNLGSAYGSLGDHVKERDYLERALKILEAYYRKDHVEIAITLINLGNAYGSLSNHEKKRDCLERALKIQEVHYGKDCIEIANTLDRLGSAYGLLKNYEKKRDCLKRTLKIKEAHYGKNHVEVAGILNNLGNVCGLLSHYKIACDYLERALKINETHYGKEHIKVALVLNNLSTAYNSLGNHIKAHDCLKNALKILINSPDYGEQHPLTQKVMGRLIIVQPAATIFAETAVLPQKKEEKQKSTASFFNKEQLLLKSLIKKYKLLDDNQTSLEKGLRNAAANGHIEDLKIFARYVENLNSQDENPERQRTAAHWAAINGHEDCYNFLVLEKKARHDIPDASNKTANEYREMQKTTVAQP